MPIRSCGGATLERAQVQLFGTAFAVAGFVAVAGFLTALIAVKGRAREAMPEREAEMVA